MKRLFISVVAALLPLMMMADEQEARLLRFPSVGGDKIAFTYAGDLYTVPINGGSAKRLTSDIGFEMFSRFSPDGKTIAFTAQYDGNTEVYSIPSDGGIPKRLTYTAAIERDDIGDRMGPNNIVMCWTPDGKNIVLRSKWHTFSGLRAQLSTIPAEGGELTPIPTTEGGFCSYSPDGKMFAMNRMFREFRTWKYYRGGQSDDIWINRVGTTELKNITDNPAQDIFPMWIGKEIYFMSDRDGVMNLFCYDVPSEKIRKVTNFDLYDCKFPSFSSKYIVFENGGYIYKFSVADQKYEKVPVYMNAEGLYSRDKIMSYDAAKNWASYSLSPDAERMATTFRGDIFTLPASKGAVYNLMPSPGSHERNAVWSPDGKNIAFISDMSGEYQIYVMPYDNPGAMTALSDFKEGYPDRLSWSPDSKKLYFITEKREFCSLDIATKALKTVVQGKYDGIWGYDISFDGKWIAYATASESNFNVIYLYDVENDIHTPVTTEWYDSENPMFSSDGKYLFFTSRRNFKAMYSAVEWNAAYRVSDYAFVLPLSKDVKNPVLIEGNEYRNDETASAKAAEKGKKKGGNKNGKSDKKAEKETAKPAMKVDLDGIIERAVALPIENVSYLIAAYDDNLYFQEGSSVKKMSLKTLKVSDAAKGRIVSHTSDFKKALLMDKSKVYVVSIPGFSKENPVPTADMQVDVDFHKEWKQIFDETWRIYRDYFYVENMVGKDWKAIYDKYAALLPYVNHRQDLTYIIGEMISELATGHCYVTTGEAPRAEKVKTGLLGAVITKDAASGYFRIDKIFKGVNWGNERRSPLAEPGLNVAAGDFILEVNGRDVRSLKTVYEALIDKAGKVTALKVNRKASVDGARTIYVKPVADESQLAYFDWVQENIRKVDEMSGGKIGYIHIPDMSIAGLDEFTKLFYAQLHKKALIIDDRMNGGGNVSPMIIERLQRVVYRMTMYRNGGIRPSTVPESAHYGPKVCLVDKYSSSDGDLFPYGFQKLKLGKIIGTRTWGGIVGISGSKPYLDGQDVRTPFFTSYSTDGKWIIENHGVDPDIVIDINPFEDYLGNDAQLNKAVEVLLDELKSYKELPPVPLDPVRTL